MTDNKKCGHIDCNISTGIHGALTFGWGELDDNGFWEFPCSVCAREFEKKHPKYGSCWPHEKN